MPTLLEVECALRDSKSGKVGGLDGIESDLLHKVAEEIAPHVWPLACKMVMWTTEPIQFKGGNMAWLHKKGTLSDPKNYRGILLTSNIGKRLQASYRTLFMQHLEKFRPLGQLGGFRHRETIQGNHYIRSLLRTLHVKGYACAIVFIDLAAAFHSLVRETLYGWDQVDIHQIDQVMANVRTLGGNSKKLWDTLVNGGYLQDIDTPGQLIAIMREMSIATWTKLDGNFVQSYKGTRPGSPMADVMLFHYEQSNTPT